MYARSLGVPGGDPVMLDVRVAARLGFGEHGEGILERARLVLGLRRSQRPFAPLRRLRCQDGRALEEGGRAPAPGRPPARARWRRFRRAQSLPERGARLDDRGRAPHRSPPPTRGELDVDPQAPPRDRSPTAPRDAETACPAGPPRARRSPRLPARRRGSRAARPHATAAQGHLRAQPPRRATTAESPGAASEAGAGSFPRADQTMQARLAARNRLPAAPVVTPAAAPTTQADYPASPPRSARAPLRPTATGSPRPRAPELQAYRGPPRPARAAPGAPRPAPAPRTASAPTRPTIAAPRTPTFAPRPGPANARRRSRTRAGVPPSPPRAAPARPAEDRVGARGGRASGRTSDAALRMQARSRTPRRPPGRLSGPTPTRSRNRARPSFQPPPHLAPAAHRCVRPARPRADRPT